MNRASEIQFLDDGSIKLNPDATAEGFALVVQGAMVNLISEQGSDTIFEERGTTLLRAGLSGSIVDRVSADHQAAFASADTLFFSREWELADTNDKLAEVRLAVKNQTLFQLELAATFISIDGRVMSYPITNPVL